MSNQQPSTKADQLQTGAPLQRPFALSMNLLTTSRIASITIKSAVPTMAVTGAGIHLLVQGTNRTSAT